MKWKIYFILFGNIHEGPLVTINIKKMSAISIQVLSLLGILISL